MRRTATATDAKTEGLGGTTSPRFRDECPHRTGQCPGRGSSNPARGPSNPVDALSPAEPAQAELAPAAEGATLRRRLVVAALLTTATVTIVLAVPPLRAVARQIEEMNLVWVAVAVAVEVASCAGFVVIFRLYFDRVPAGMARELAWTEEASGALLPTGGLGALAIGGWLLRQAGMSTRTVIERSSALFFMTSAVNVTTLVGAGVLLATGAAGGRDTLALAGLPIALGVVSTGVTLALPVFLRRTPQLAWPNWLVDVAAGIDAARRTLVRPSWRLLGALGYLFFDIAALGATFAATGRPIPIVALVLGYVLGYLANMIPIPGGFGVLEAGIAGTLIAYGAPATQAAAAVVVYHTIAFWIPSLGGLIGYARLRRRPSGAARDGGRHHAAALAGRRATRRLSIAASSRARTLGPAPGPK